MSVNTGMHVFVVKDEGIIASTLGTILRQNGYLAESFTDPIEALHTTSEISPDLLISDVVA